MKQKRNLLIIILLSGILGWALGFLRLPYIEKDSSFLLGFLSALALMSFVILLLFVWNKNALLLQLIGKNSTSKDASNPTRIYKLIWMLVAAFIIIGGLVSSFLVFQQHNFSKNQIEQQKKNIAEQTQLLASTRKSNSLVLINNLFNLIDEELKNSPKRILSEETIARVEALNYAFEPDSYAETDSLASQSWSSERGQLLLMLSTLKIDSSSFMQLKMKTTFRGADLRNANLSGADLSGVDLRNANLKNANLSQANLKNADLRSTNLWGANLKNANLKMADLKKAKLMWAELNEANLTGASLNWVNMTSAKLRGTDLTDVNLEWSNLKNSFFNDANLTKADLTGADFRDANLKNAILKEANLKLANLSHTNLNATNLIGVNIDRTGIHEKNWIQYLSEWNVKGIKEIQGYFKIIEDGNECNYRLVKK